jgi:pimeloyl-ACP methyl ester carboxylesterase
MSRASQKPALKVTREARGKVSGDGIELSFGYWPGRGAPVVALHGLTASYVNFIGIAERLAGRSPLLALDLRGRGDSDKPNGPYGLAQHARDVAAAMQAMDLGPSIIVGHSMGAFIATALAAQNPELVAGLILIDGGYLLSMPVGADAEQVLDSVLSQRIEQLQETYPSREVYREFWRSRPNFPPTDWGPWTEAFLDYEVGGEAPQLRPKAAEAAVRFDVAESFKVNEVTARLKTLRVPVKLLRAAAGFAADRPPLIPDAAVEEMRAFLPNIQDEMIPDTTHYTIVLGERGASRVADVIAEFTNRNEAKSV